jgi:alpha-N-acetylglucosaminidase
MILIRKAKTLAIAALLAVATPGCAAEVAPIRAAYNYCTLSYTFAYFSDAEWQAEIDRLAEAGYNVALVTDGTFKVWQMTLRELGYGEEEILAFIPDECARAWWLMGNLTGEGGPLDQSTIDEDGARGRFICDRMREKGIEPILQGFVGMMPLGHPSAIPQGLWSCYERPPILDPTGEEFAKVAAIWYKNLEAVYGFKPKYLAGDLFHEGGSTAGIDVTEATRCVQAAQQRAFPGTTWIVQSWQANPTAAVRAGLDPRFTLIEALVKDMSAFDAEDSVCALDFGDLPWIWCEVLNFGGNHGLYGNLKTFARLGRAAKGRGAKTFRGYGALSEGFFTNPVCYDLFEDMMMRPAGSEMSDAKLCEWLERWVEKRYGLKSDRLQEAWKILADTVYACPRCQEGTVENVICAEPSWTVDNVSAWGPRGGLWYGPEKLERAAELFDEAVAGENVNFGALLHDRYDVKRQVAANRLRRCAPFLEYSLAARREFLSTAFAMAANAHCQWSGIPKEFRLEPQLERARARGGERCAKAFRRMVTTWADEKYGRTTLSDYANREYVELISDYYLPRWMDFLSL